MSERKCKNWLASWRDWVLPRSEAPESFILWAGLFCLSSTVRRNVYIGRKYLGGWTCYPHQYIIFVAPPGFRKTTTLDQANILLEQIEPEIVKASTFVSSAAIIDSLVHAPKSSIYMTYEELGDIINKTGLEMFEFLTSMYDGKRKLESKTMARGIEFAQAPCINMAGGTTPMWISSNLPESLIGGGFASRVIWVYEDRLRAKRMYYRKEMEKHNFDEIEKNLVHDLQHILSLEFEWEIEPEALDYMEDWYQNEHSTEGENRKILGYLARKPTHIHKVAQLIHIAYSDEPILTKYDFVSAIATLEGTEKNLPKVFTGVGKNVYSIDMKDISEYITERGTVTRQELLTDFNSVAEPNKLMELVTGLILMKVIVAKMDDNSNVYYERVA